MRAPDRNRLAPAGAGKPSPLLAASSLRMPRKLATISVAALAAAVVVAEAAHWRANGRGIGPGPADGRAGHSEAVVVLGYRDRGMRANVVNRWRVRAGIRSQDPTARESLLVVCGGAVGGPVPEAELMGAYARRELGYAGPLELDVLSRTTWENVANAIPLIEGADAIKIVSNSLHAAKARDYLQRQRPDLAARLVRGDDYRPGEQWWLKPYAVLRDLRHTLRSR
jgi:hypothetical protein